MVRTFAANGGALSARPTPQLSSDLRSETEIAPCQHERWLDRAVPLLVVAFLLIAAVAIFVQFAISRNEALKASENNLAVAAQLAAGLAASAREPRGSLASLPAETLQPGRHFFLVDERGHIVASRPESRLGQPLSGYFAEPEAAVALATQAAMLRLILSTGEEASVTAQPVGGTGLTLVAFHPVEDELLGWRATATAIGGLIACFAAILLAFSLTYYAQRSRTRDAGRKFDDMSREFEIALEYGNCGIWDWAVDSDEIGWSASMHRLLGRNAAGRHHVSRIAARLHPEDGNLIEEFRSAARAGRRTIDRLFRMQADDGNWLWLRMRAMVIDPSTGRPARIFGIVMDVTAERLAEEESHRADARLRDAIESISEAFVLWDENNRLVLCNSKYQSFHGLDPLKVRRGVRYRELMDEAIEPRIVVEIERSGEREGASNVCEAQFQDGRWLQISERHTGDGGFVAVGTDITARKRQEEQLFENERQLRMTISDLAASREALRKQASQMSDLADRYLEQKAEAICANRAKAEFLANMHHEIRTPLQHIIGFAEMIEQEIFGPLGDAHYRDYAQDIQRSGASLLALFNDILEMAHIEAGRVGLERTPRPVGALLADAAAEVAAVAEAKRIAIEIDPELKSESGRRLIHVDANAVSHALAHLLRNAIRLSPMNGKVALHARMHGRHVNFFISDLGSTLTAQEIGAIRDPFGHIDGMLENGCKGSGLGVAIARSLIELHGGTLKMRSSPSYGSIVLVRLPVDQEPVQLSLPILGMAA